MLAELQADVNGLLEKVLISNLPSNLKDDLVSALEELRATILEYRIIGVEALNQVLKSNIGAVILNKDAIDNIEGKVGREIINEFGDVLGRLDRLVSFGIKAKQLIGPVLSFLALQSGGD